MAGKKENVVVTVISDLTLRQAAELQKQIIVAKSKYASSGRGTIATGTRRNVSALIQGCHSSRNRIKKS